MFIYYTVFCKCGWKTHRKRKDDNNSWGSCPRCGKELSLKQRNRDNRKALTAFRN